MSRWLVNQNGSQQAVDSMAGLVEMARRGRLGAGAMIQPPGTSDWLYAVEVPELKTLIDQHGADAFDDLEPAKGNMGTIALAAVLVAVLGAGSYYSFVYSQQMPDPNARLSDSVSYSQMVVTGKNVRLVADATAESAVVAPVADGTVLELMAKRGDFYKAQTDAGQAGWLPIDQVLPMYLIGGGDVMKEYDPLYNPDRYLVVQNAGWMQLPEQREAQTTVFQFMLRNMSDYDMTDLVMTATIKDSKGHELEVVEFAVEGVVPSKRVSMVGTLHDADTDAKRLITQSTFDDMAEEDPELRLEYNDGVEVTMQTDDFTEATIDIVELRAVPKTEG